MTLAQIELTENDLQTVADKAATVLEWRCSLQTFTKEAFVQAMRDADAAGKNIWQTSKRREKRRS